jgi:hypothetical protein
VAFESGQVSEPDHLWAIAQLPSDRGPRWMPVDARPPATASRCTPRAGRRAVAAQARPRSASAAQGAALKEAPSTRFRRASRRAAPAAAPTATPTTTTPRATPTAIPAGDLVRVARHLAQLTGERLEREGELRRRCLKLLQDPALGRRLLELLRG